MSLPSDQDTVKQWRRTTRSHLIEQRIAAGGRQRKIWNTAIHESLHPLLHTVVDGAVAFYWPFKGEFDCRALMREMHGQGARLALPAVVEPRTPLEFRLWRPGIEMVHGAYKIPVPKARDAVEPAVVIAPLVGFDLQGYRLGYGSGYYDRTLAALHSEPVVIGVGYEISKLDTIFPQPHDIAMQKIVTEAGLYEF